MREMGMRNKTQNLKTLYQSDGHKWYFKNAELLRQGKLKDADIENIAEELESMGKGERKELRSYLIILFLHLLKWKYQRDKRGNSWKASISIHRKFAKKHLKENPSLKGYLTEIVSDAYEYARIDAINETGLDLDTFPEEIPFTLEDALTESWFPN